MDCLRFPDIGECSSLYGIQSDETVAFIRKIFNQIQEHANRVEFSAILDDLNLLCGDQKFLEIIEDEESENLVVKMFFTSEAIRQVVQEAIIKRGVEYRVSDFDEWQLISNGSVHGLRLSDLQMTLILGRDHYYIHYTQTILKRLKELQKKHSSLMKLPEEFLFQLCTFLPIRELSRFSRINRKAYELINSDKSDLVWLTVADNYRIKVNLQPGVSVKEQIIDPWLEMPFGKIHQLTYEVIISKTYLSPSLLDESCFLFDDILPIFTQHIPKEYYFQFEYKFLDNITLYLIFYRNDSGEPQHQLLLSNRMTNELTQLTEKLSETLIRCTGKFE